MIQQAERFFSYVLLRCSDPRREEHLNVGVAVYDEQFERVLSRFDRSLERIKAAFPDFPHEHIRDVLDGADETLTAMVRSGGLGTLERATSDWDTIVRISHVRSISASTVDEALQRVYAETVAPAAPSVGPRTTRRDKKESYTSGQVVKGVEKRLLKRGLRWEEMVSNARIEVQRGETERWPVWYPFMIRRRLLFDAFDVEANKDQEAWERAMLVSEKAGLTLRTGQYQVSVTIREKDDEDLMYDLKRMIETEGAANGSRPDVFTIRSIPKELDDVVDQLGDFSTGELF